MALSFSQLDSFYQKGYCKIPAAIATPLVSRLRDLFDELMSPENKEQKATCINNGKEYVTNLDLLCCKGNLSCLELLGSPFLLEIAEQICGPDFFMIQEFAVIKNAGDELPVYWHQDMVHDRKGQCFTIGFYLDDAEEHDGALRVVPGSHQADKPVCELCREPFIEVAMKAGDILLHDMMLAHCSEPMRKNKIRRVLYFEFLSRQHALLENIYTDELIINRTHLVHAALHYYQQLHPEGPFFSWANELAISYGPVENLEAVLNKIYSMPIHARPSTYCFEKNEPVAELSFI